MTTPVGAQRRQILMRSAARLFLRNSYDDTSVNQICAASGISGPGLYRHFSSKQDLLLALIEDSIISLLLDAQEIVSSSGFGEDSFRRLIELHADRIVHGTGALVIYQHDGGKLSKESRRRLRRSMVEYVEIWTDCLVATSGDDAEEARVKVHGLLNMLNSYPMYKQRITPGRAKELLMELALSSVGLSCTAAV